MVRSQAGPSPIITAEENRRMDLIFGIGYDDDLEKAKNVLKDMVDADQRILTDPAPLSPLRNLGIVR